MGWPELIYLALNVFGLGLIAAKGKVEISFLTSAITWIFITIPLLWWGGFFA